MGKRCACERLLRQLEEDARLRTLPMAAQMLWLRLMRIAASTPGFDGVLRFGSDFGFLVSVALSVSCAETEAETNLAILERRGLVVRGEDGASLVLPEVERSSARAEAARINGLKGGAPRKGETKEARRERRQRELMLAIPGGHPGTQPEPKAETSRETTTSTYESESLSEVGSSACEELAWVSPGRELVGLVGMPSRPGAKAFEPVRQWMQAGASPQLIREVVQRCLDRPGADGREIVTLRYFNGALMQALEGGPPRPVVTHRSSAGPTGYEAVCREWQRNGCHGAPPSLAEWRASQAAA